MSIVYRPEKIRVPGNSNSDITKDIEHLLEEQQESKETKELESVEGYVPDTVKETMEETQSVLETEKKTGEY